MKGYVYILRSEKTNRFYLGSTIDLKKRLHQHKSGLVKATRNILPLRLEFSQEYESLIDARRIEYRLKKFKRKDFIEKIIRGGLIKMGP